MRLEKGDRQKPQQCLLSVCVKKKSCPKLLPPTLRKKTQTSHYPINNVNEENKQQQQQQQKKKTENKDALSPNWNRLIGFNN